MPFHDLSLLELVSCPETESKLSEMERWLYAAKEGDALYPIICGTPVLQPLVDQYLQSQMSAVCRAMAEWGEKEEVRYWYFSRYGQVNPPEPLPVDCEVVGEGYPGFWELEDLPPFVTDLELVSPESLVLNAIGEHHPQVGLDLGCGQGAMTQQMAQRCRQVIGLEQNFYLAALGNKLLRGQDLRVRYLDPLKGFQTRHLKKDKASNANILCGDANQMPFSEPLFDWVHCGHILDLLDNPSLVLANITKILKPGGWLSICSPWDSRDPQVFLEVNEFLQTHFQEITRVENHAWLRFNHLRRFILHDDWIWVGKLT